jgi:hypothetical protein
MPIVTRGNLKDIALTVMVVRDHVRHVHTTYRRFGQVLGLSSRHAQLQFSLDEPLRQCPSPKTVGRELLARQVHQPDVTAQFPLAAHFKENRRRQHHRGRRRVIVIRAACGHARAAAA